MCLSCRMVVAIAIWEYRENDNLANIADTMELIETKLELADGSIYEGNISARTKLRQGYGRLTTRMVLCMKATGRMIACRMEHERRHHQYIVETLIGNFATMVWYDIIY